LPFFKLGKELDILILPKSRCVCLIPYTPAVYIVLFPPVFQAGFLNVINEEYSDTLHQEMM